MPKATGASLDRVDGPLKVSGKATYTADQQVAGLAHAVLVTSGIAKGRIASIDTAAAERLPDVLAILTHKSGLKLAKDPSQVSPASPADRAIQVLQSDQVLYANQPVAVAVARTLEAAFDAASRVKVKYAAETPHVRMDDGLLHAYVPKKVGGGGDPGESRRGDFSTAFSSAEVRLQEIYSTPFQTHSAMEPHATIAVWDTPEQLTLYDTSQGIFGDRKRVAELLGLKAENVRVISLFLGGGFGSKGPTWSHAVICALAARAVKRPLKLVLRRPQMWGPVGCRSETRQTISLGADRTGKLLALENETVSQTSTFDEFAETATMPSRMLYSVANNHTVQKLVRGDIGTPSYTRAPGECPGSFAIEVAMDEMAYRLKIDPLELRLKNYAEQDEDKKLPWSEKSLRECYRRGAERFGWSKRPMEPRATRKDHMLVGWGMATSLYPARRSPASAAARIFPDGKILVESGSQDLGGGTYTIMTQIAADQMGVPMSSVTFRLGDTRMPETPVSGGSQTAATAGTAVYEACAALRKNLYDAMVTLSPELASSKKIEDLRLDRDVVVLGDRRRPLSEVMPSGSLDGKASTPQNPDAKTYSMYSFGAQFAEVHVDADLGTVKVNRMVGCFDAGTILNAKTGRSQFIGGMVWGISMALHEKDSYDERLGRIVNNNLAEYLVPTNRDIPAIEVEWVESSDLHVSPMGARGIGEIGITGAAAAIANAVFHATGKRIREVPITADLLL
jgi:xanthine dehydrogenase YagR molybdenum-binding subunit